jgi:protein-tyrosine phosphatase
MSLILDNLILASAFEVMTYKLYQKSSIIINAAIEVNIPSIHDVTVINLNWQDTPGQDINKDNVLLKLIHLMDSYIYENKTVIVNCYAGISRSSTIVIAYLIAKNKWSIEESINFVKSRRIIVNPNEGFITQLKNLQPLLLSYSKEVVNYLKCPPVFFN